MTKLNNHPRRRRCPRCNQRLRVEPDGELEEHMQIPSPYGYTPAQCLPQDDITMSPGMSHEVDSSS